MIIRKSLTQWLWVLAAVLIVIGVIRFLIDANLLAAVILGAGLVLALIALVNGRRSRVV